MKRLYEEELLSCNTIASRFNLVQQTVYVILLKLDVKMRPAYFQVEPTISDEELRQDIVRLTEEKNGKPTTYDVRVKGKYALTSYYNRFGSFVSLRNLMKDKGELVYPEEER